MMNLKTFFVIATTEDKSIIDKNKLEEYNQITKESKRIYKHNGPYFVSNTYFDIKRIYIDLKSIEEGSPTFICGFEKAGTFSPAIAKTLINDLPKDIRDSIAKTVTQYLNSELNKQKEALLEIGIEFDNIEDDNIELDSLGKILC